MVSNLLALLFHFVMTQKMKQLWLNMFFFEKPMDTILVTFIILTWNLWYVLCVRYSFHFVMTQKMSQLS